MLVQQKNKVIGLEAYMKLCKLLIAIAFFALITGCLEVKVKSTKGINKSYDKNLIGCWELYKGYYKGVEHIAKAPVSARLTLVKDNGKDGYVIAFPIENGFAVLKGFSIETDNGNFLYYQVNEGAPCFISRYEISKDKNTFILFQVNQKKFERLLAKKLFVGNAGMLQADNIKKLTSILAKYGKNIFSGKEFYFRKIIRDSVDTTSRSGTSSSGTEEPFTSTPRK